MSRPNSWVGQRRINGQVLLGLVWWPWKDGKARLATAEEVGATTKLTNGGSTERSVLKQAEPLDAI
eukprot:15324539-Ditylum_brightwellii.AAC.2